MNANLRSASSTLSIVVVSFTKLFSLIGWLSFVVPDNLSIFLLSLRRGFSDNGGIGGCGNLDSFLLLLLFVELLLLMGSLHFLLSGRLEGLLIIRDVEGLEGIGHQNLDYQIIYIKIISIKQLTSKPFCKKERKIMNVNDFRKKYSCIKVYYAHHSIYLIFYHLIKYLFPLILTFFYVFFINLLVISSLLCLLLKYQLSIIQGNQKMQAIGPQGENYHLNSNFNVLGEKNKSIIGKKITKTTKTSNLQTYYNEIQCKNPKKNQQNSLKKANQLKNFTQSKKSHKKKHLSIHRNTQTPDLFIDRRVKTEGPSNDIEIMPTNKKEKKTHSKSISQAGSKNVQPSKKQRSNKPIKASKDKHIKSCQIYGAWKRLPDMPDHTISETIHGGVKKKRNNSSLICNDKVVSKLLNVSLLASELGGSRPVTSDRKSAQSSHSKTFKEYMNSIDLRIIRNIQDDVPIFLEKQTTFQDTIRSIMKKNQISLEQLTRKVIKIQRSWRKRHRNSVIDTYKRLFQRATDNFFRQDRLEQVSQIDISIQKSDSNIDLEIFRNQNLAASLKKSQGKSYKDSIEDLQNQDYRMRWIQQSEANDNASFDQDQGLNLGKYRQLVKQQIRSLNKKIGVQNQQKKGGLDSKYLLEELMKHNFNKKWIQEESSSLSDRKIDKKENLSSQLQSQQQQPDSSINQHTIQTYHKQSKNQDQDGSFDESQVYDRNKYAMASISLEDKIEVLQMPLKKQNGHKIKKIQVQLKPKPQHDSIDVQWINKHLLQDEVIVKNYLDCGLDNFSLQINQTKVDRIEASQESFSDKEQYSSDQAIGQRFQRANIAILRRRQVKKSQQPIKLASKDQGEQLIGIIVNELLNEFAQDISVILKKCNASLPQRPKNVAQSRPNGIQTGYNSIKQYVTKVIAFARQRDDVLTKITENINKDIGPTSLEILSYLRPEPQESQIMPLSSQSQDYDDEDGLFVIPAELFEEFQTHIEGEYRKEQKKEMGPRIKAYLSFWNRCIFESYNQCLDYERPFGIEGKPYDWLKEKKVQRKIAKQKIPHHLQRAENRLLQQTQIVAGIIFERQDPMLYGGQISDQQMHLMNQQRLSRILASELLQSENSWVNYNDELAQLLVELSRVIEEKLFFEFSGSELKKVMRHRRMLAEQSYIEQAVEFSLDELQ